MTLTALALTAAVKAKARSLGFDAVAAGPARPEHAAAFDAWLEAGYAGGMDYLARTRDERREPARLLAGVRSVIAVAALYDTRAGDGWRGVARYARGRDYHDVMKPKLAALAAFVDEAAGPGARSRPAVDTSAVLERDLAAAAGLGWIGKNTNLLSQALGSYFFIGIVLTTAELVADAVQPDRCGTCTACLDACPTRAFPAPYVLDARRCLAYLTIEHRGAIPEELRPAIDEWIFGCDACQEVCPWNRKAPAATEPAFAPGAPPGDLASLLALDEAEFRARFHSTALMRAKRSGLLRNAALALGNRGDRAAVPALERAAGDADPVVREAAAWALRRLAAAPPPLDADTPRAESPARPC
jgi:epoxyqueuosine reductase